MSEHINRRKNLLSLYSKFVLESQGATPGESVHGLDRLFAKKLQIANSSLSTYKSGGRPMGPKIARQIESILDLAPGWLDADHQSEEPAQDEVDLNRFLKLAKRAFESADAQGRLTLSDILKSKLPNAKENGTLVHH